MKRLALLATLFITPLLHGAGRHALIVCNQNYQAVGALKTPLAEAKAAEETLATLGFQGNITVVTDATTAKMLEAVDTFASKLGQSDVALFFYGGHAIQAAGENYLLGVDSDPATSSQLAYKALPLGRVLTNLEGSGARLNLLILDCCRDNPLPTRGRNVGGATGLAPLANAPRGTFIAYAADANQQAWDDHGTTGLYGSVLFAKMKIPGMRLEDIFIETREEVAKIASEKYRHQQEPAEYSKISGSFFFRESHQTSAPATTPASPEMPRFSTEALQGSWHIVEKVVPQHGGWAIHWKYTGAIAGNEFVLRGQKTLVNNKKPTQGELRATSEIRLPTDQIRCTGSAHEVNFRGESIEHRVELTFDPSGKSFSAKTYQGEEWISSLTGSKQ